MQTSDMVVCDDIMAVNRPNMDMFGSLGKIFVDI